MIKLFEALREGGTWKRVYLPNITEKDWEAVDKFKKALKDKEIHFEFSLAGSLAQFDISCKSDDDIKFVDDYLRDIGIDPYGYELQESKLSIDELVERMRKFVNDKAVKEWGFDNPEDAFLNVYKEEKDDATWIWLLGEFTYNTMSKLADGLDQILKDGGYPDSYFDAETSGRWCAVIWKR